jgi:hypothetical protein
MFFQYAHHPGGAGSPSANSGRAQQVRQSMMIDFIRWRSFGIRRVEQISFAISASGKGIPGYAAHLVNVEPAQT